MGARSLSMQKAKPTRTPLERIADRFFSYLGKNLPQACASDEFYFLPRSEAAVAHLHRLDDFRPQKIEGHIEFVRTLLHQLPAEPLQEMEAEIDRLFLKQSMESFIREFEDAHVWRKDPTLYIKIPLFATDQALSQIGRRPTDRLKETLRVILERIPGFLKQAAKNLESPSEISLRVGLRMAEDALRFYQFDVSAFIADKLDADEKLLALIKPLLEAWDRYKEALGGFPAGRSFAVGADALGRILSVSLNYHRSVQEILEVAEDAFRGTVEQIDLAAKRIDASKPWKQLIYEGPSPLSAGMDLLTLYRKEVVSLREFFYAQNILTVPAGESVDVLETPSYLKSLRATASYRAPLTGGAKSQGTFYVHRGKGASEEVAWHCPYLSAHETYPGHHILDHLRIHHLNPIRRQIESPLFYEGWACYAEQLLDEFGYVKEGRQRLIQLKRRLWRALRAVLDVNLQTGGISPRQAVVEIQALGYSREAAQRQALRFCLTPGYQLCYLLGDCEIRRLRRQFEAHLGVRRFHDLLLDGGEIPFHLVEQRLAASPTNQPLA
jgi:hypothetical protein